MEWNGHTYFIWTIPMINICTLVYTDWVFIIKLLYLGHIGHILAPKGKIFDWVTLSLRLSVDNMVSGA